jgi:calcineurin-like phosphoesterase family protein
MNYWLTTDSHFGHEMLVEEGLRPKGFEDLIFKYLHNVIKKGDVLIHFGDISFGSDAEWNEKLKVFDCHRWLLIGNHDKRTMSWYLDHGWNFVGDSIRLDIFGYKILMSHIPERDSGYDINIHGHFHDTDHRKHEPEISALLTDKHVLLALEHNNYQPWNLRTVVEKFKKTYVEKLDYSDSKFPILVQYSDTMEKDIIPDPKDLQLGRSFKVLELRYKVQDGYPKATIDV